jgi:hypothetical protein
VVLARRVGKIEEHLDPEAAVLRWLTEAHEYGTLEAYTETWLDAAATERPVPRIAQQVEDATRERLRRQRRFDERAIARAVHAAVLRVQLVVQLNVAAMDSIRVDGMVAVSHHYRMRELAFREALAEHDPDAAQADSLEADTDEWMESVHDLASRLDARRSAQERLEERFLAGRDSLFPETAEMLDRLWEMVEGHLAIALADEYDRTPEPDECSVGARAESLLALASRTADAYMGWT